MLNKTSSPKLNCIIALLMVGIFFFAIMPAQADDEKFIGPKGGKLDAGFNSSLIIPAGALGDEASVLEALDNALALLDEQAMYIDSLSTVKDDPSGEWIKEGKKDSTLEKNQKVADLIESIKQNHEIDEFKKAKKNADKALKKLSKLRENIDNLLDSGKIGGVAHELMQAQNDHIEVELAFAESQLGQEIEVSSCETILLCDDNPTILEGYDTALSLLDSQYAYISQLKVEDDGSGEWVQDNKKQCLLDKTVTVKEKVNESFDKYSSDDGKGALKAIDKALDKLDKVDEEIDKLTDKGKLGSVANDTIQDYIDEIYVALEWLAIYRVLNFEFGPSETEFLVPAELAIPFDEVLYSDAMFWYSDDDDEVVDLIDMDYFIDDDDEEVHFLIPHFSEYYYTRR